MTDNPKLCPCEMLKRALAGENYEIVSELVDAHFVQLAEIERLKCGQTEPTLLPPDNDPRIVAMAEEVERLRGALDEIEAKALKQSLFPSDLITSYDMRRIADIARAAREKREAANE